MSYVILLSNSFNNANISPQVGYIILRLNSSKISMSIYNKILVVADINSEVQPALERAMQLASKVSRQATFYFSLYL